MSWKNIKLGEVAETTSGGTPNRSIALYWDGNIPWLKSGELNDSVVEKTEEFITEEGLKNSSAKLFKKGTLLLALYGATAGKLGILNFESTTNQALCAITPKNGNIDNKFLLYFLLFKREQIIKDSIGGAQPNISQSYVRNLSIPLPALTTQQKIAAILDHADALRKKDQQLLVKYDELLRSVFNFMFGDPVKNEKRWEVKKLKEISSKILSGNTPKGGSQVYVDNGIVFFRSQNVWKNELIYDDIAFIDEGTHSKMKNSSLKHKDILMTKTGRINTENSSLGRAALFLGEDNSANVNGHVYLIRLKQGSIHEFILTILTSVEYRDHIRKVCVGGIDKRQLNKEHIEDFPIIYPPITLQDQFASIAKNIQRQREITRMQMDHSENLFQSLLQKAFKGELIK
ncbi:MAG: restriction endonuclease subunit S [Pedobacter sp.]|nr:MAG: restriction endonuclease subunit S [Pedobacter sp.]